MVISDVDAPPLVPYAYPALKQLNLHLTTPEKNFGSGGQAREVNALHDGNPASPADAAIYAQARAIADQAGIQRIVDVGCGHGERLMRFFPSGQFNTLGIDLAGPIASAAQQFSCAQWMVCDLAAHAELCQVFAALDPHEPVLLILSEVIAQLPDPRALLSRLRTVLMQHSQNRLVISSPDRSRMGYATADSLPGNPAHVREWTMDECMQFLQSCGFQIAQCDHITAQSVETQFSVSFAVLQCDPVFYLDFLQQAGLLFHDTLPQYLLITTEYADVHTTGKIGTEDIGTFVAQQRLAWGTANSLCLLIAPSAETQAPSLRTHALVHVRSLTPTNAWDPLEETTLHAVQHLLFYIPTIKWIAYADHQGWGCRLVQAKQAGLFAPDVHMVTHCHGNTHYLENANQAWYGSSHLGVAEREKISLENADLVMMPTKFLRHLYAETGIEMAQENILERRYPYQIPTLTIHATNPVDTLLYYGERTTMKGHALFLEAISADRASQLQQLGVKRIVFIVSREGDTPENRLKMADLERVFEVEELSDLDRQATLDKLHDFADSALCVMPYLEHNHPYALLDATFMGMLPIMLNSGGVPELVPAPFSSSLLAQPNAHALLTSIAALVALPIPQRHQLRVDFLAAMRDIQAGINQENQALPSILSRAFSTLPQYAATVMVPVFNTELQFLRDLAFGLNHQSLPPVEVIFIDDASEPEYARALAQLLQEELRLPYRILQHPVNRGLAAARNTGLAAANTPYLINIDSDNIPSNDFVKIIVYMLEHQPQLAAAVTYLKTFDEKDDFNLQAWNTYAFRPLGDGVIASLTNNQLGDGNAGYRVSTIRELGGWDETDKSMWEDFALFLKLISSGHRIGVIPKHCLLYRVRQQSMLRTYNLWPAMRRIARNMQELTRYESFRLQAIMHSSEASQQELALLRAEINALSSHKRPPLFCSTERYPRLFALVQTIARKIRHFWRMTVR